MGFFNKLEGNKEISLNAQAGLLLAAITMVAIDGSIDDDEIAIIKRLDGNGHTEDWEMAIKAWKSKTLEECIVLAASSMSYEQKEVAIANLIDIAMADGILVGNEKLLLETYVDAFNIRGEFIEKVVDVVSVKNNKSLFKR